MPTLSSLAAPEGVIMIPFGATSDNMVGIVKNIRFPITFQYYYMDYEGFTRNPIAYKYLSNFVMLSHLILMQRFSTGPI